MDQADTTYNKSWSKYERYSDMPLTKVIESYQNVNWWREETIFDIVNTNKYPPKKSYTEYGTFDGNSFYNMDDIKQIFPNSISTLNEMSSRLTYLGYNPNVAIFHVKHFNEQTKRGPLLTTYWKQSTPYNKKCPDNSAVGCVPVAIGQILNYHKWPQSYASWNEMGGFEKNEEAKLLAKIGSNIGMVYGKDQSFPKFWDPLDFGDLSQAKKFFSEHQYSVTKQSPKGNLHKVSESILNGNPVYMEGTQELFSFLGIRFPSLKAHAWVCDGYTYSVYRDLLVDIYLPRGVNPGDHVALAVTPYERDYSYIEMADGYSWSYYHMNWGWGIHSEYNNDGELPTKNNGWFLNADISQLNGTDFTVFYRFVTAIPNK